MTRPALSATRGMAIIDFLAANSNEAFTLAEIASAVEINSASCHAIVNALNKGGYLSRLPGTKSYTLGPVLVAAGIAAQRRYPVLSIAHSEGKRLAEELNVPAHITAHIGDEILTIDTIPSSLGRPPSMLTGQRRKMDVPPIGAIFHAWSSETIVEKWLSNAPPWADEDIIKEWRRELVRIRKNGYQVRVWSNDTDTFVRHMEKSYSYRNTSESNLFDTSIEFSEFQAYAAPVIKPDEYYEVILICAPIFDANGKIMFVLNLTDFENQMLGEQITDYASRVVKTCFKITHLAQLQQGQRKRGTSRYEP